MNFLIDTNVISEWVRPRPDPRVVAWFAEADEDCVFVSVVTLGELRHGIERIPAGNRQKRLDAWLRDELPLRFEGRILSVDANVADMWGKLVARCDAVGRPIGALDALIAATAEAHNLTLVTRNVSDFKFSVTALINPWIER